MSVVYPPRRWYGLMRRTCRHIVAAGSDRAMLEHELRIVQAAGYNQFRIRTIPLERAADLLTNDRCGTCRIDPTRGELPAVQAVRNSGPRVIAAEPITGQRIMPGACLDQPGEIEQIRKLTHDAVIDGSGPHRASGVRWYEWKGKTHCVEALELAYAHDQRPVTAAGLAQFRAFFDEHPEHCVLVIAVCDETRANVAVHG